MMFLIQFSGQLALVEAHDSCDARAFCHRTWGRQRDYRMAMAGLRATEWAKGMGAKINQTPCVQRRESSKP